MAAQARAAGADAIVTTAKDAVRLDGARPSACPSSSSGSPPQIADEDAAAASDCSRAARRAA